MLLSLGSNDYFGRFCLLTVVLGLYFFVVCFLESFCDLLCFWSNSFNGWVFLFE